MILSRRHAAFAPRSLLALSAIWLLSIGASACGSSKGAHAFLDAPLSASRPTTTASTATSNSEESTKADSDKDNDIGALEDDKSNSSVLDYGQAASPSDKQAVTTLVKRYYAAANAGDGAKACSMLYSTLAEAVPEDFGSPPGPPYMRGTTCPMVTALLFKHFRNRLAAELPKLRVTRVRLVEHHGLALLSFGTQAERQIFVHREGKIWKMAALLDSALP